VQKSTQTTSALAVETAGWREGWGDAWVWVRAGTARLAGRPFTILLEMVSPDLRKGAEMEENLQLDEPWAKLSILPPFSLPDLRNDYFNERGVF